MYPILQHLDVDQPCGVIDGAMFFLVSRTATGSKALITCDPVDDALRAGKL